MTGLNSRTKNYSWLCNITRTSMRKMCCTFRRLLKNCKMIWITEVCFHVFLIIYWTPLVVYDFLLVVYSNFCRITHRFWEIWCETIQWPWNMPTVIDSCITWNLSCGHVCKMFGRQWTNEPKIESPFTTTPLSFDDPSPANPREYLHKPYTARN